MKVSQPQRHTHTRLLMVKFQVKQGLFGEQEFPSEKDSQMVQLGDWTLVVAEAVAPSLFQTTYRESSSVISALKGKINTWHPLSIVL